MVFAAVPVPVSAYLSMSHTGKKSWYWQNPSPQGNHLNATSGTRNAICGIDAVSGLSHYAIYADGVLVATTTATSYEVTGLESGKTYAFVVAAVDFGALDPETSATLAAPFGVQVTGFGARATSRARRPRSWTTAKNRRTRPSAPSTFSSRHRRRVAAVAGVCQRRPPLGHERDGGAWSLGIRLRIRSAAGGSDERGAGDVHVAGGRDCA